MKLYKSTNAQITVNYVGFTYNNMEIAVTDGDMQK